MRNYKHPTAQVAFFDGMAPDVHKLATGIPAHIEPVILSGEEDPVVFIARVLTSRPDVRTVHIFGHGGPGHLSLNGVSLDAKVLPHYSDVLASIGEALQGGDILIYGCSVGAGAEGAKFVRLLADLTGANVAAAEGLVGAEAQDGRWDHSIVVGAVSSPVIEIPDFEGVLASGPVGTDCLQQDLWRRYPGQREEAGFGGDEPLDLPARLDPAERL